jgi:hypothetical protein
MAVPPLLVTVLPMMAPKKSDHRSCSALALQLYARS